MKISAEELNSSRIVEQFVLGGLLKDASYLQRVCEVITPDDFTDRKNSEIYEVVLELFKEGSPIDLFCISEKMIDKEYISDIEELSYIEDLINAGTPSENIIYYSERILELSSLAKINSLSNDLKEATEKRKSVDSILELINKETQNLNDRKNALKDNFKDIKSLLSQNVEEISERYQREDLTQITGLSTGLKDLDQLTNGLLPGKLIIVAGRPGMGKSALSMNMVESVCLKEGKTVAVFSMEMEASELTERMISSIGKVDSEKIRNGNLTDNDWSKISSAIGKLNGCSLVIDETPALSVDQIISRCKKLKSKKDDLSLIVIDYLQLMSTDGIREANRASQLGYITGKLKALAKELKCPVICLSQLNRDLEKRPDRRPQMSDLRESGAIEQDADLIIFIYRDEVYNPDSQDKGVAELIVAKQRGGRKATVRSAFLGEYTRFENLKEGY